MEARPDVSEGRVRLLEQFGPPPLSEWRGYVLQVKAGRTSTSEESIMERPFFPPCERHNLPFEWIEGGPPSEQGFWQCAGCQADFVAHLDAVAEKGSS